MWYTYPKQKQPIFIYQRHFTIPIQSFVSVIILPPLPMLLFTETTSKTTHLPLTVYTRVSLPSRQSFIYQIWASGWPIKCPYVQTRRNTKLAGTGDRTQFPLHNTLTTLQKIALLSYWQLPTDNTNNRFHLKHQQLQMSFLFTIIVRNV